MNGSNPSRRFAAISSLLLALSAGVAFALTGCNATSATQPPAALPGVSSPPQAIAAAIARQPAGVTGTFKMVVRGTGRATGRLYLNSEKDYRDQRCLSIALTNSVDRDLRKQLDGDPATKLIGQEAIVTGNAERVVIWIYADDVKTPFYYYQTRILVSDLSQIKFVPAGSS